MWRTHSCCMWPRMLFPTPITCHEVQWLWWLSSFCFLLFQVNKMKKIDKTSGHEQALKGGSNTYDTFPQNSPCLLYIPLKGCLEPDGICLLSKSQQISLPFAHLPLESSRIHSKLQQEVYISATHCMSTHLHGCAWRPYPINFICWPLVLVVAEILDSCSHTTLSLAHRIFQTIFMCSFTI